MALPPKWYQFLVSVFAYLGSLLYVSVFTGGAFFGAMFAGELSDRLGRKYTILLGALIFILGGSLQTAASHLNYLYAGRCLAGAGVGFLVMISIKGSMRHDTPLSPFNYRASPVVNGTPEIHHLR
ncbi:hypothetical protein B0T10DRAFT_565068 [Thelonectria olida]|uniref:Major facilitator superfamily (MFS) profile domain-containing protein n=1 Tax=Thelonectria olida TaxID=1576542 RepID=A0A9P8VZ79_9HYPO|nr:hypothetical protein B0T10DRAFT_565068 [Thelonectria olida]